MHKKIDETKRFLKIMINKSIRSFEPINAYRPSPVHLAGPPCTPSFSVSDVAQMWKETRTAHGIIYTPMEPLFSDTEFIFIRKAKAIIRVRVQHHAVRLRIRTHPVKHGYR
jgi:hypothetical protein